MALLFVFFWVPNRVIKRPRDPSLNFATVREDKMFPLFSWIQFLRPANLTDKTQMNRRKDISFFIDVNMFTCL